MMVEATVPQYHVCDLVLEGPTGHANPFLVTLEAELTHESGAPLGSVPGFYDGEGRWVIRVSPPREGEWRGRTTSDEPALDGVELRLRCTANHDAGVHGTLGLDPAHPRRFAFADGTPFVPLGFGCDWLFAVHQADPARFRQLVDLLAERGFNYLVTNVYAHTGFAEPTPGWLFAPPARYVFEGSNEEPDHTRLNVGFFQGLDEVMRHLQSREMVAHLMLQVQNKHVNWPPRRSAEDDRYWRYVVARYQAFGNLVWDVGKESYHLARETGGHEYTLDRMELIRRSDAHGHLVTVHDPEADSAGRESPPDEAADFVSDQVHLGDVGEYNREAVRRWRGRARPYMNIEYGYEEGAEPIRTYRSATTRPWPTILVWTYAIYLGGGYPCYYYTNAAWDLVKWEPEPPGWRRYRYLADLLASLDINAMSPDNELVRRGLCLAEPGRQYLVFLPEGGDTALDLTDLGAAQADCLWLDAYTGDEARTTVAGGGFATPLENPLPERADPCAVVVRPARDEGAGG